MDNAIQDDNDRSHGASVDRREFARKRSDIVSQAKYSIPVSFAQSPILKGNLVRLLCEGLSISEAARRVGTSSSNVAHLRRAYPEFDAAVQDAIELGTEAVQARLRKIALTGDADSMATVRAAEVYLKGTHSAYRAPNNPRRASARITRTDADGNTYTISATADGIPD